MDVKETRDLVSRILKMSRATETEVTLGGGRMALTSFADNHIHQNTEESWPHVSIRVGQRVGRRWYSARASTRSLDRRSLQDTVDAARRAAKLSHPDPSYLPMVWPKEAGSWPADPAGAHDPESAASGPAMRASLVSRMVLPCRKAGLIASGHVALGEGSFELDGDPGASCIANSRGLFQFFRATSASASCTVQHPSGARGWAGASGRALARLETSALADRAMAKALAAQNPRKIEAGSWTVILEPEAFASLFRFALGQFSRRNFDEGLSSIGAHLGERIFAVKMSITDDPYHPLHRVRPFDDEGMTTQQVEVVRVGVPKGFVYARPSAEAHRVSPTGHAPRPGSSGPELMRAPVVDGGLGSVDDLVARTDRGLLVTRLWYNHLVDPLTVRVRGMTGDGLFVVEEGAIVGAARNMRFDVSVVEVMRRIDQLGTSVHAGGMVVPPVRVRGFNLEEGRS